MVGDTLVVRTVQGVEEIDLRDVRDPVLLSQSTFYPADPRIGTSVPAGFTAVQGQSYLGFDQAFWSCDGCHDVDISCYGNVERTYVVPHHDGSAPYMIARGRSPFRDGGWLYTLAGYGYRCWSCVPAGDCDPVLSGDTARGLVVTEVTGSPVEAAFVDLPFAGDKVVVSDGLAYAAGGYVLAVIDVSDPETPVVVALDTVGPVTSLVIDGYAYLSTGARLVVRDYHNPAEPIRLGSFGAVSPIRSMAVALPYVWLNLGEGRLVAVDVSDPVGPVWAGCYQMGAPALSLAARDSLVVVSHQAGVDLFKIAKLPHARPGDANATGTVDILDVIYTADFVFRGGREPVPFSEVVDVNADGKVDVADILYLITHIFKGGPVPCNICSDS